jgi:hypothetical protein
MASAQVPVEANVLMGCAAALQCDETKKLFQRADLHNFQSAGEGFPWLGQLI